MNDTEFCRLCAKLTNSTIAEKLFERRQKNLLRQIEELIGQRLQNVKDLPQLICEKCQDQMLQVHLFRKCCIRAQNHFATAAYKTQMNAAHRQSFTNKKDNINSHDDQDLEVPSIEEVILDGVNTVKVEEEEDEEEVMAEYCEVILRNKSEKDVHQPATKNTEECSSNDGCSPLPTRDETNETSEVQSGQLRCFTDETKAMNEESFEVLSDNKLAQQRSKSINSGEKTKTNGKKSNYICDQCGAYFTSFSVFTIHLRRHAGDKPFECEICPEKFFSSALLLRHIRKHTGEKPYPCRHCDRRFLDMSTRLRHERVHNNDRPFACQQCGKAFTVGHTLVNHMLTHTNERAFSCKMCNVSFKRKPHLITHYRSLTHQQNEATYNSLPAI